MASILLVDDDEQLRSMLRIVLDRAGYQVQEASNGKEALDAFSRYPADLLITDIIMPDKEGLDTIMELRHSHPDLKIIAMSGGGRVSAQNYLGLAKMLGANLALAKPFSIQELLDSVKETLHPTSWARSDP
jgi:DNA-binding response OmpR family regulator